MTILRANDSDNDWTFGKGVNDYLSGNPMVAQDLETRLLSFLGDCFFDIRAGIDWFNLLGAKDKLALELSIQSVILNTRFVIALQQMSVVLDSTRNIAIHYSVTTVFPGTLRGSVSTTGLLLTQDGDVITDESGEPLAT